MKLEAQNHEKDERTERTYVRLQQAAVRICQLESVIDDYDDGLHLRLDNLDVILNSFY